MSLTFSRDPRIRFEEVRQLSLTGVYVPNRGIRYPCITIKGGIYIVSPGGVVERRVGMSLRPLEPGEKDYFFTHFNADHADIVVISFSGDCVETLYEKGDSTCRT
jgi:hypothetical protein